MIEVSVARSAHGSLEEKVECCRHEDEDCPRCDGSGFRPRRHCAGCGCKDRALMAPEKGISKGYAGAMFCMGCNPRFVGVGPLEAFFAL